MTVLVAEKAVSSTAKKTAAKKTAAKAAAGEAATEAAGSAATKKTPAAGAGGKQQAKRKGGFALSGNQRVLVAEYVLCMVILGLGAIVSDDGADETATRTMIKGSALSLLFFLLAIVTAGGKSGARAATGLGTLVTAAYVLTSPDMKRIVTWMTSYFGPEKKAAAKAKAAAEEDE